MTLFSKDKAAADPDLQHELQRCAEALTQLRQEFAAARNAVAGAEARELRAQTDYTGLLWDGTLLGNRAQKRQAWEAARAARRQAWATMENARVELVLVQREHDRLVGEIDRRGRGWTAPTPVSVPALPDDRLPDDERAEALATLLTDLQRRRQRAAARLDAAQAQRDKLRHHDGLTPYGAQVARHADAEAEFRARMRDAEALAQRYREAEAALRTAERAVAVA